MQDIVKIFNPTGECKAALSWESFGKSGYVPHCANRFNKKAGCRIAKGVSRPCEDCAAKEILPVTVELFNAHRNGSKDVLGIYPLVDAVTPFVAGDFDNHGGDKDPAGDVARVVEVANGIGIPVWVFRSRSGKGYHIYIFFRDMVLAILGRRLLRALLDRAGIDEGSSFDSIYPKQDVLLDGDFGSLIALPWHGTSFANGGSRYDDTEQQATIDENIEAFLEDYSGCDIPDQAEVIALLDSMGESTDTSIPTATTKSISIDKNKIPERLTKVVNKCRFVQHCRDDAASLSEPEWYYLISVFAASYGGPGLIHALSEKYPKYSRKETQEKILHAIQDQPGPIKCETIRNLCGGICSGCNVGVVCPIHLADAPKPSGEPDLAWVNQALMGVQAGKRRTTGKALARYYMSINVDENALAGMLTQWNTRNTPPMDDGEIPSIISEALVRRGTDDFSRMIGVPVSHMEHIIMPDRDTYFLLYLQEQPWPVKLLAEDVTTPKRFQNRLVGLIRQVVAVPAGRGSAGAWATAMNGLLSEAEVVERTEDETVLSVLRDTIKRLLENSEKNDEILPDKDGAFVWKGRVYLKLPNLQIAITHHNELKSMKISKLTEMLRIMGFTSPKNALKVKGHRFRAFICPVEKFEQFEADGNEY